MNFPHPNPLPRAWECTPCGVWREREGPPPAKAGQHKEWVGG